MDLLRHAVLYYTYNGYHGRFLD